MIVEDKSRAKCSVLIMIDDFFKGTWHGDTKTLQDMYVLRFLWISLDKEFPVRNSYYDSDLNKGNKTNFLL